MGVGVRSANRYRATADVIGVNVCARKSQVTLFN